MYSWVPARRRASRLFAVLLISSLPARSAIGNPRAEDIDFLAEHLPESAMDARFLSLPWPGAGPPGGGWRLDLSAGYAATSARFARLRGPLLAASVGHGLGDHWTFGFVGSYDELRFSGNGGSELLHPLFSRDIPLDLPELARFSGPRGDYLHWGAGVQVVRSGRAELGAWRWNGLAGLTWDRVELRRFAFDYTLLGGANAGVSGVLDHSATYDYLTPLLGVRGERDLGGVWARWSVQPRAVAGIPLPARGFAGRIQGPGFDVAGDTKSAGRGAHMGDPFVGLAVEWVDRRTGWGVDLGSTLYFAGAEGFIHRGIDRALLAQLGWHGGRR